jgi:hypothetical protein
MAANYARHASDIHIAECTRNLSFRLDKLFFPIQNGTLVVIEKTLLFVPYNTQDDCQVGWNGLAFFRFARHASYM